eukprot:361553-Hanusia_phi.AAC.1
MDEQKDRSRGGKRRGRHLGIERSSVLSVELLEHGGTRGHDGCEGSRLLRFAGVEGGLRGAGSEPLQVQCQIGLPP